jgi:hypothetical protein
MDSSSVTKILDGRELYRIGDIIELMLKIDSSIVGSVGPTIEVQILDVFGNIISNLTADNIGNGLYVVEYIIPTNLSTLYNILSATDENSNAYNLLDVWVLPDGSQAKFNFDVSRLKPEQPVSKNAIYEISLSGIVATDNSILDDTAFRFTSSLTPFYCSVSDVVDVHSTYLSTLDQMQIIDQIVDFSETLDMNLKPDHIVYQDRFDNATRNWVAYTVAYNLLSSGPLDVTSETKSLNGFSVSKSYDRDIKSGIHRNIREYLDYFQLIVLAGGKDTPFTSKTFAKGIFDPKRPRTNRSNLDTSDFYPWVNASTSNTVITNPDGSTTEIEGSRTIGFRWRLGTFGLSNADLNSHATFSSMGSWSEQQETSY